MEAIKNLRESSVLLSNAGFVSYSSFAKAIIYHPCLDSVEDGDIDVSVFENIKMVVENCARYTYIDLLVALDKWAVEDEYRVLFDAMMAYRNGTSDKFFHSEHRDEELSDNVPEEEYTCELSATMSNVNDDRSEEEKKEKVFTPEEEDAMQDAFFEAHFGACQCFMSAPRTMVLGTYYKDLAEHIYSFECARFYVVTKPSDDLDIEKVRNAVLAVADSYAQRVGDRLREEAIDADYRALYRELYILVHNSIADIDEDIYLHDAVPYSIEMQDGHRVVCPHFEQLIEADEVKEAAFIDDEFEVSFDEETGEYNTIYTGKSKYDEDFDLILNEETGKVEMCRDHTPRLTEEDYEEMERLEADDSYDPIAEENHYPADDLPF